MITAPTKTATITNIKSHLISIWNDVRYRDSFTQEERMEFVFISNGFRRALEKKNVSEKNVRIFNRVVSMIENKMYN